MLNLDTMGHGMQTSIALMADFFFKYGWATDGLFFYKYVTNGQTNYHQSITLFLGGNPVGHMVIFVRPYIDS